MVKEKLEQVNFTEANVLNIKKKVDDLSAQLKDRM